jgi:putative hydrolase of HD superfamily
MQEIQKIFDFIIEIEKLKDVYRKTRPVGLDRFENSAEHSWHVSLCALLLKEYANEKIDIDRVIKMLLIHDLGEIDAGDTIVYESENQEVKDNEEAGLNRILALLPKHQQKEYKQLWEEFESTQTPESKYAKAIDRIPPLLHNLHGDGHSWKKYNISKEKVFTVNSKIEDGATEVWNVLKEKLDNAVSLGLLK